MLFERGCYNVCELCEVVYSVSRRLDEKFARVRCVLWWIGPKLCAFNVCDFQTKNNLVGHKYTVSCPSECEGIRHVQISARRCL